MVAKIILIILLTLSLGISMGKHGQKKEGDYNWGSSFLSYILIITLLYLSGFFNN